MNRLDDDSPLIVLKAPVADANITQNTLNQKQEWFDAEDLRDIKYTNPHLSVEAGLNLTSNTHHPFTLSSTALILSNKKIKCLLI